MKEKYQVIVIFGAIAIIGSLILGTMYLYIDSANKKLNICAKEYGYKERNNWEGGIYDGDNYSTEMINGTYFACCLNLDYLENGEVSHLNCTSAHKKGEIK
jgi:hypothetical protein